MERKRTQQRPDPLVCVARRKRLCDQGKSALRPRGTPSARKWRQIHFDVSRTRPLFDDWVSVRAGDPEIGRVGSAYSVFRMSSRVQWHPSDADFVSVATKSPIHGAAGTSGRQTQMPVRSSGTLPSPVGPGLRRTVFTVWRGAAVSCRLGANKTALPYNLNTAEEQLALSRAALSSPGLAGESGALLQCAS